MTRRHRTPTLLLSGLAAGALLLPACGDDTVQAGPGSGVEAPAATRLDGLELDVSGGFVPVGAAFASVPQLTVTAEGQVITGAAVLAIYPGPLLRPLSTRSLDAEGRAALAQLVRDSGLLTSPAPDFGVPGVADAPTTTLTVTIDGVTTTLAAAALREARADDPSLTDAQQALRADLRALVDQLGDLEAAVRPGHLGTEEQLVPEGLWLQAMPAADVADPTAGQDDGEDGEAAEEPRPRVVEWTVADVDLASLSDAVRVDGAAAAAALAVLGDADELTRFRQDGVVYQLLARPALPGDDA